MKLTSTIFLGLGMSAALASGDSNLRANISTSSRHLSNSSQISGGTWMYYLMLNALHGPLDAVGKGGCCSGSPPSRCGAPHLGPSCSSSDSSSGGSSSSSGSSSGGSSTGGSSTGGSSSSSSSSSHWWSSSSSSTSDGSDGSDGDEADADGYSYNDDNSSAQEQYLTNEYNNGDSGNATQVNGSKGLNVWPFLAAALVVGVVAAALMAKKKRQQRSEPNNHTLSGSVQKRMALFGGGMFRKEKPAATSSLYENDYENEPSL